MSEAVGEAALERVLATAERCTGVDFSAYRVTTLMRRVRHRMATLGFANANQYADHVEANPDEQRGLLDVLLVKWTTMFREPATFEALRSSLFSSLFEARFASLGELGRIWVPACATGEDAFSLGMCLLEWSERRARGPAWSVVASDVNPAALESARAGAITDSGWQATPPELREFLARTDRGWRLVPRVRQLLGFEQHDILASRSPAPRLAAVPHFDLVLCRNLTIYLTAAAQDRLFERLLKVMAPGAVLVLGQSESLPKIAARSFVREQEKLPIYRIR